MKIDFLTRYGVESIARAFYFLGRFESVLVPKENENLIRDIKIHLDTLGMNYNTRSNSDNYIEIKLL